MKHRTDRARRGAALVEMAFTLPVLCLFFIGAMDLVSYGRLLHMTADVSNKISGAAYALRVSDLADSSVIDAILNEVPVIAKPFDPPQVSIRFCEWAGTPANPSMFRDGLFNNNSTGGPLGGGGGGRCNTQSIQCNKTMTSDSATLDGHGAFVQVTTCNSFEPIVTGSVFKFFNTNLQVQTTSYIPLTEANQTQMIAKLYGARVQEYGNPPPPAPPVCTTPPCGTPTPVTCTPCSSAGMTQDPATCACTSTQCPTTPPCGAGKSLDIGSCSCGPAPACAYPGTLNANGRCETANDFCGGGGGGGSGPCCPPGYSVTTSTTSGTGFSCVAPKTCPQGQRESSSGVCIADCFATKVCPTANPVKNYNTCTCDAPTCQAPQVATPSGACGAACDSDEHRASDGYNCAKTCDSATQVQNGLTCTTCPSSTVPYNGRCVQSCDPLYEVRVMGTCKTKCGANQYRNCSGGSGICTPCPGGGSCGTDNGC